MFPDSGWYNCHGVFPFINPPTGGGSYHVKSDSILLHDLEIHTADFDWTLILNGSFAAQFRSDSIVMWQNDTTFHRYRYINLALAITDVRVSSSLDPNTCALYQNFPNPFNPTTTISFHLAIASEVSLIIFDMLGRQIETLLQNKLSSGMHSVHWKASTYPSGIYLCRIEAGDFIQTKKLILLK